MTRGRNSTASCTRSASAIGRETGAAETDREAPMLPPSVLIIGFTVLLICAYFYDEWKWRVRPREKLIEMIRAADWRLHPKAMAELRRRGEDLAVFVPRFLPLLAAASRTDRVAA